MERLAFLAAAIVNRIEWDGAGGWQPPNGLKAIRDDTATMAIGGTVKSGKYQPPASATPPKAPQVNTVAASVLLGRLTDDEYTAIMQAASAQLNAGNGQLARWLDLARTVQAIVLDDPATIASRESLLGSGLLSADRADIIFAP